ncbi:MAG: cation transporter [Acidimicrobiales bacterium]
MITTSYTVQGMTCGHCVEAVRSEVAQVDGVTAVSVDLETGALDVTSVDALDRALVAAAVDEAGYELTP